MPAGKLTSYNRGVHCAVTKLYIAFPPNMQSETML
jgi:hypothetical protein